MKSAIYSGSFDPITFGHISIINRACAIFNKVFVAVANNFNKKYLFSMEERLFLVVEEVKSIKNCSIITLPENELLVRYCLKHDIYVIVRGLRAVSEFEYEIQISNTNKKLAPKIETIFLMAPEEYLFVSSSIVKEVFSA